MMDKSIAQSGSKLIRQTAGQSFIHFQRLMHPIVNGEAYIHAVHSQAIAFALQRVANGEVRKLMIAVPPRHFKSYLASVALPTFLLGVDPKLRIVCSSYGQDLADEFASQSRAIMSSPLYRSVFPNTRLSAKKPSVDKQKTTHNGYRFATSTQGVLTGFGADVAIIDDPMKAVDATSQLARDNIWSWFQTSLMTRFDKPGSRRVVVVMQRLHQDDLIGRLLEQGGWEILELPGVFSTTATLRLSPTKSITFNPGDILFPERFDQAVLDAKRHELGAAAFAAQILQKPTPAGGHLFDLSKAKRFSLSAANNHDQFEAMVVSVDCAVTDGQSSDYTAMTTWGVRGQHIYLLDAHRGRWSLAKMVPEVRNKLAALKCKTVAALIETGGSGHPLAAQLELDGVEIVKRFKPSEPKGTRADLANLYLEQGRIRLPFKAPWLGTFENELTSFPHGKNDDLVDSFSQFPWCLEIGLGFNLDLACWPSHKLAA